MRFQIHAPDSTLPDIRDALIQRVSDRLPHASVQEVGSTAVPGIIGKGDLDLLVTVADNQFEDARRMLDELFARNPAQLSTYDYQGYTVSTAPDVAIQLTVRGGRWDDFQPFLDALQRPVVRQRYNALKRAWDGQPMEDYRTAKRDFIQANLHPESLAWAPVRQPDVVVCGDTWTALVSCLLLAEADVQVAWLSDARTHAPLEPVEISVVEHTHRTATALGAAAAELFAFTDDNKAVLTALEGFRATGVLWSGTTPGEPAELERMAGWLLEHGRAAEILDDETVRERTGLPAGAGVWVAEDGRVQPGTWQRLCRRAADAGVQRGPLPTSVQSDGTVVMAARSLTPELIVFTGPDGGMLEPSIVGAIQPARELTLVTSAMPIHTDVIGRAGQGWTAWGRTPDSELAIAGARWAEADNQLGTQDLSTHSMRIEARLRGFLRDHLAVDVPIARTVVHGFSVSRDQLPVIGPLPGDPTRIVAAGLGPHPTTFAFAAARRIVDGILDGNGTVPWCLSSRRMVRWRMG